MGDSGMENYERNILEPIEEQRRNVILKGTNLIGDIKVNYDLELDGKIKGNIISEEKSNVIIKGNCEGSIKTKGGNVDIEGQMSGGEIIAGGDIKITGKFNGSQIKTEGKISVDGEFGGKLEGKEIEIGPEARGKGEIFYREFISIAKGAKIEGNINKIAGEEKDIKSTSQEIDNKNSDNKDHKKVVSLDPVQRLIKNK